MNEDETEDQPEKPNTQETNAEDDEWNTWIVASGRELMEAFGLTAENRPTIKLNPKNVPNELRPLIPYAEEWGIDDDLIRADVIRKAPPETLNDLVFTVAKYKESLYNWLGGPEAYLDEHTDEYNTFSAMMMAFEEANISD
jgi:hypothetical protein